ncbi:MAG TPA: hypothetical protein VLK58_24360 [Conexibacter sp.]|nr:hypothetical protein [Conexibacter sp.]
MRTRAKLTVLTVSAMLAGTAPAVAATAWTQVDSRTDQNITTVEYRSDTQAWFATDGGQLFSADGTGAFQLRRAFPGVSFTNVAFDATGTIGLATSATGQLYRSADAGTTWNSVTLGMVRNGCSAGSLPIAMPRLNAAFWADATTVYVVGGSASTEPVVLRSTNGGATFTSINWQPVTGCRLGVGGSPVTDGFAVPGNPDALRFITESFGSVYTTNNGLASDATMTGAMINNTDDLPRFAIDGANPSRIWAADHSGTSCGSLCFAFSETGGSSDTAMTIVGTPDGIRRNLYDVAYAGGTVVAVGDAGEIYTSVDGKNAYLQRAGSPLEGTNWRAVDLADAGRALVGGAGGRLVKSVNANAIPDTTPPTATIAGPSTANVGQAVTFTASVADEPGGSGVDPASLAWTTPGLTGAAGATATFSFATAGPHTITFSFRDLAGNAATTTKNVFVSAPVTPPPPRRTTSPPPRAGGRASGTPTPSNAGDPSRTSTGGATVTTYRRISLRRGSFVPVWVSARTARRFVIEIRTTGRRPRRVASQRARLGAGKKKLVRVVLRRGIRTGKYVVTVRVFQGRRAIGKRVRTAFVIAK